MWGGEPSLEGSLLTLSESLSETVVGGSVTLLPTHPDNVTLSSGAGGVGGLGGLGAGLGGTGR